MIKNVFNKFQKKDPTKKEALNNNETETNETSKKSKGINKKPVTVFDKYINYVDNLLGLISIWGAIIIFGYAAPILPELRWPYYLDEIVFFVLLYILVDITVKKLRPVVFIALVVGSGYLIVEIVLDVFQDSIDKTKTTQTINLGNEEVLKKILSKLTDGNEPVLKKLDSFQRQNVELMNHQKDLEHKLDSLVHKSENLGRKRK